MKIKIKVIIPNSGMDRDTLRQRENMLSRGVSQEAVISVDCIGSGPASIESHTDEWLAGAQVIEGCRAAERDGFDAVVVYCFSDLAVDGARENVKIPVIGPGEVALAAADMISQRFSVVTTISENIWRTERRLMKSKVAQQKLKSVRALNIPVLELRENPAVTEKYLEKLCGQAVREDGIDTLILGCLGMAQYGAGLEKKYQIKVLDPALLAVACAELAARLGIVPAEKAYPPFRKKCVK